LDTLVSRAQARGLDVVYTFGRTPAWASSNRTGYCQNNAAGSCYPPASQQYWKDFVTAISLRYAGKIKYWELWNEPNAANSWTGTTAQMVTMAQNAYPIIKANASGAVVLSAGPQGPSAYIWLDDYLAAGGGTYADGFSFHGYLGNTNGIAKPAEENRASSHKSESGDESLRSGCKAIVGYRAQLVSEYASSESGSTSCLGGTSPDPELVDRRHTVALVCLGHS